MKIKKGIDDPRKPMWESTRERMAYRARDCACIECGEPFTMADMNLMSEHPAKKWFRPQRHTPDKYRHIECCT